ncbi:MAG: substrate-binding domain-containing protein [Anaeromyxobacter sp.]
MKPTPKVAAGQASTLLEVARAAKVSPSTVSRILNGTARVSDAKRRAVEAAIARLDFRPNLLARGLRQGRGMSIGILTQVVDSPFFTAALKGVEEGLADSGYAPVIVSGHWNAKEEAERVSLLLSRRVDGIIILTGLLSEAQIVEFSQSVPIVVTGHRLAPTDRLFAMTLDNVLGGYLATRHLLELGHRQIAFLAGPPEHADAVDRMKGYRKALKEAGVAYDPDLVVTAGFEAPGGLMAVNRLLESHRSFTAVFAANDEAAFGARLGLYRRGIRVPEDVSLVGFDDLPGSVFTTPPLTTVRQPLLEMGRLAARSVLGMLAGERPELAELPQVQLVVRETTRRLR